MRFIKLYENFDLDRKTKIVLNELEDNLDYYEKEDIYNYDDTIIEGVKYKINWNSNLEKKFNESNKNCKMDDVEVTLIFNSLKLFIRINGIHFSNSGAYVTRYYEDINYDIKDVNKLLDFVASDDDYINENLSEVPEVRSKDRLKNMVDKDGRYFKYYKNILSDNFSEFVEYDGIDYSFIPISVNNDDGGDWEGYELVIEFHIYIIDKNDINVKYWDDRDKYGERNFNNINDVISFIESSYEIDDNGRNIISSNFKNKYFNNQKYV